MTEPGPKNDSLSSCPVRFRLVASQDGPEEGRGLRPLRRHRRPLPRVEPEAQRLDVLFSGPPCLRPSETIHPGHCAQPRGRCTGVDGSLPGTELLRFSENDMLYVSDIFRLAFFTQPFDAGFALLFIF